MKNFGKKIFEVAAVADFVFVLGIVTLTGSGEEVRVKSMEKNWMAMHFGIGLFGN